MKKLSTIIAIALCTSFLFSGCYFSHTIPAQPNNTEDTHITVETASDDITVSVPIHIMTSGGGLIDAGQYDYSDYELYENGLVASCVSSTEWGGIYTYTYDDYGRVTNVNFDSSKKTKFDFHINYTYDDAGNVISERRTGYVKGVFDVTYEFDELQRPISRHNDASSFSQDLKFEYNEFGDVETSYERYSQDVDTVTHEYDIYGNQTLERIDGNGRVRELTYTYGVEYITLDSANCDYLTNRTQWVMDGDIPTPDSCVTTIVSDGDKYVLGYSHDLSVIYLDTYLAVLSDAAGCEVVPDTDCFIINDSDGNQIATVSRLTYENNCYTFTVEGA